MIFNNALKFWTLNIQTARIRQIRARVFLMCLTGCCALPLFGTTCCPSWQLLAAALPQRHNNLVSQQTAQYYCNVTCSLDIIPELFLRLRNQHKFALQVRYKQWFYLFLSNYSILLQTYKKGRLLGRYGHFSHNNLVQSHLTVLCNPYFQYR